MTDDKRWYYITVQRRQEWNFAVFADDRTDAEYKALQAPELELDPDYVHDHETIQVSEVTKFVE